MVITITCMSLFVGFPAHVSRPHSPPDLHVWSLCLEAHVGLLLTQTRARRMGTASGTRAQAIQTSRLTGVCGLPGGFDSEAPDTHRSRFL